ncbi:MAG: hypothetical protein ACPGQL_00865 [Thermoplasmatota archaeon]
MRFPTLLVVASLLMTGLAFVPGAAAESDECTKKDYLDGQVRITRREDCSKEVVVFEDIICVGGWGGKVEREVDGDRVAVYYCDGGLTDRIELSMATTGCPRQNEQVAFIKAEQHHNCRIDVYIHLVECVWNGEYVPIVDADVVTVYEYQCTSGTTNAARAPGIPIDPCPITDTPAPVDVVVDVEQDKNPCLDTTVTVGKGFACTEPIGGSTTIVIDRVDVLVPGCGVSSPRSASDYCDARDGTPAVIRDAVWGRYDEGANGECDIDVEPFGACVGGSGSTTERHVGPFHVKLLVCRPPPGSGPSLS